MKAKLLDDNGAKTYAVVFETGDEVMDGLRTFAKEHGLDASHFTALGAFSEATLGFFDVERKRYVEISIAEQVEVLSLVGDIALKEDEPEVHAHVVVSKRDGTAHGGHLISAHVRPTLEAVLIESPTYLRRQLDPETGLALIRV